MYIYIRETYNALCSNLTSNFTLRKRKPQGFTSKADLKHRPLYDIIYFNIPYFSPPRNSISTTDFHRRPPTSNKSSLYTIPCFSSREQTRLLPGRKPKVGRDEGGTVAIGGKYTLARETSNFMASCRLFFLLAGGRPRSPISYRVFKVK